MENADFATAQHRAHAAVKNAVKSGHLYPASRFKCMDCSNNAVCYDHRDYDRPLAVQPVCRNCNSLRGAAAGWQKFIEENQSRPPVIPVGLDHIELRTVYIEKTGSMLRITHKVTGLQATIPYQKLDGWMVARLREVLMTVPESPLEAQQ